ncbi:hypothetical protein HDU80_006878, partial [Chytriomyces hyalinus]
MARTQTLIDAETLEYLAHQKVVDYRIVKNIELEHKNIEFIFEHTERYNNWKTDELYIERASLTEAAFLAKIHDEEQQNLKRRQLDEVSSQKSIGEDQRTFNYIMNEMKSLTDQCGQQYIARVETRQERERKSLSEGQARKLKKLTLSRNVQLRDVEDPEIRVILKGLDFNSKTSAEEKLKTEALAAK